MIMPKLPLLLALTAVLNYHASAQVFDWKDVSGNLNQEPEYVIPSDGSIVMRCSESGLFRSIDGGITWMATNIGIDTPRVLSVSTSGVEGRLFCSVDNGGFYTSLDNGVHWNLSSRLPLNSMRFVRAGDGSLYSYGPEHGVYRSDDEGGSWKKVFTVTFDFDQPLALSADSSGVVYFGTKENGIYRSRDKGAHWEHVYTLTLRVDRLYQVSSAVLYAWVNNVIKQSTDSGDSWSDFPNPWATRIVFVADTTFMISSGMPCVSVDSGKTFTRYEYANTVGLFVTPQHSLLLWRPRKTLSLVRKLQEEEQTVLFQVEHPQSICVSDSGRMYAVLRSEVRNIVESTDRGLTWILPEQKELRLESGADIIRDPGGAILAVVDAMPAYFLVKKSDNTEWSVHVIDSLKQPPVSTEPRLLSSPAAGTCDILYSQFIYRTTDYGESWRKIELPKLVDWIEDWTTMCSMGDSVLVVGCRYGVASTTNLGALWITEERLSGPGSTGTMYPHQITIDKRNVIYVAGSSYMLYSVDSGRTWSFKGTYGRGTAICVDSSGRILEGTDEKGLSLAQSVSSSFVRLNDTLSTRGITTLTTGPDGTIFVGHTNGVCAAKGPNPQTGVAHMMPVVQKEFALQAPYPNPFSNTAEIPFTLSTRKDVVLSVYNILGVRIKTLASGEYGHGSHTLHWDGRSEAGHMVPPGCYLIKMKAGTAEQSKVVMKAR
jgi:photosystem II stability/assembly factor-like uncharacterized protein